MRVEQFGGVHERAAGVPLEQIADVFGHTDTRMLERVYRHPVKKSIGAATEPMERMFGVGDEIS